MPSKAGIVAGKAFVIVEAIDGTAGTLRSIQNRLVAWASGLQAMGQRIFTRALTASLPSALSLKVFKDFDDSMRKVEARSAGTAEEMQKLRDQARELGRTGAFSARQIGELQNILGQRGFNRAQIFQMTPSILNLARAGGSGDLEQDALNASDLVAGAINSFSMKSEDAAMIADMMTAAVNESNFALEDLIISMANAGPVAHDFKSSLAEVLAILSVMRNVNIDPSVAGTGLRNIFIKASDVKARDKFNKMLKEATGTMIEFEDAAGNLKSPIDILFSVGKAMDKLGTGQRGAILAKLFGLRAITPASAVAKAGGIADFDRMLKAIIGSGGLAKKQAGIMEGGFGGAWRQLLRSFEDIGISLGEALAKPMAAIALSISKLSHAISDWIARNATLVQQLNMLLPMFLALGTAMIALALGIKTVMLALTPVILAMTLLTSSFKLALVAISVAGVAFTKLHGFLLLLVGPLKSLTKLMFTFTRFGLLGLAKIAILSPILMKLAAYVVRLQKVLLGFAVIAAKPIFTGLIKQLMRLTGLSAAAARILYMGLMKVFRLSVSQALIKLGALIAGGLAVALTTVGTAILGSLTGVVSAITGIFTSILSFITGIFNTIKDTAIAAFQAIKNTVLDLWDTIAQGSGILAKNLEAGDMAKAFSDAVASMKLAWMQLQDLMLTGMENIRGRWRDVTGMLKEWTLPRMVEGLAAPIRKSLGFDMDSSSTQASVLYPGIWKDKSAQRERDREQKILKNYLDLTEALQKSLIDPGALYEQGPEPLEVFDQFAKKVEDLQVSSLSTDIKSALDGLQRGTTEASKQFYENQMNQQKIENQKNRKIQEDQLDGIQAIERNTRGLRSGGGIGPSIVIGVV